MTNARSLRLYFGGAHRKRDKGEFVLSYCCVRRLKKCPEVFNSFITEKKRLKSPFRNKTRRHSDGLKVRAAAQSVLHRRHYNFMKLNKCKLKRITPCLPDKAGRSGRCGLNILNLSGPIRAQEEPESVYYKIYIIFTGYPHGLKRYSKVLVLNNQNSTLYIPLSTKTLIIYCILYHYF